MRRHSPSSSSSWSGGQRDRHKNNRSVMNATIERCAWTPGAHPEARN